VLPYILEDRLVSYSLMMERKFSGLTTRSRLNALNLPYEIGLPVHFQYNKEQQAVSDCLTLCAAILD